MPSRASLGLAEKARRRRRPTCRPARPTWSPTTRCSRPPFVGSQVVKGIPIDEIAGYINETALFRNQWQFRPEAPTADETDDEFKARIRPDPARQLAEAKADDMLVPQVVYGYFPANGDGNDLVIWTDETRTAERTRFRFPRQTKAPYLCIADFFRPVDCGEADYAAFHIVTMGPAVSASARPSCSPTTATRSTCCSTASASRWPRRWPSTGTAASARSGASPTRTAPALAGLFRQQYRGGRYSWGYPACPDLEDNVKVVELLDGDRIGIECSEETGFQYQPEQTTSALICHHPQAKYFVAR